MTTQFKVGQRVRIAANDLVGTRTVYMSPNADEVGLIGIITELTRYDVDDVLSMYPDAVIEVEGRRNVEVDTCFLVMEEPALKKGQTVVVTLEDQLGIKHPVLKPQLFGVTEGQTGEIIREDGYEKGDAYYSDALVKFSDGRELWLDVCFLIPGAAQEQPQVTGTEPTAVITDEVEEQDFGFAPVVKTAGAAKKLSPQCAMILDHLKNGHSVTQRSALLDFGVMALPRRIADLKDRGFRILSQMELNKLTGQRYARYSLAA